MVLPADSRERTVGKFIRDEDDDEPEMLEAVFTSAQAICGSANALGNSGAPLDSPFTQR